MQSIVWNFFFTDLEQLVLDYEQLKASNFTTNVSEIAHNLRLMYWDYICHSGFPCRSRCSQVVVLSLRLPETIKTGQPGRPKFDINEKTLIELRTLGLTGMK